MAHLWHAVYDEAGDAGFEPSSSQTIVGAAILCKSLHDLQRVAWGVRKEARKGRIRLPELKARLVPPWMVYEGLRRALHWDRQAVVADKRYTSSLLRDQLVETTEAAIALAGLNTVLSIEQVPSEQRPELLLAHYMAWAVFQKCERGNPTGYDIVRARIVVGDVAGWQAVVWAENKETAWHPEGRYSPFETE